MKQSMLLIALAVPPVMTGCTMTASGGTEEAKRVACRSFEPIRWSRNDTPVTVRQVKGHNAAWKAVCG